MLRLALSFELRSLARTRVGLVAMVAYVFIGLMAIGMGASHVATWQAGVVTAEQAQQESIDEARGYFALGKSGPDDRSWVDLSESRWQNEYAGTRVIRRPGALAGIAAGSVDPAPVAVQLGSRTDPLSVTGYRIENPEIVSRSVDLVFVLTMLTPLLVGVLGLGLGSREREAGIDRLVIVQAGAVRGWLVARGVAITVLVGAAVAGLCVAAALVGGAGWIEGVALLTLGLAYTGLWGGLLLVVAAHARTVRVAAFEFGAIWTVLCVLLPAAAAEVGVGRVGADFAIEQTLDARAEQWGTYDQETEERIEVLYARFPELTELPAAAESPLPPSLRRHTYKGAQIDRLERGHAARLLEEQAAARFALQAGWVAPPIALTVALERIAGVGPEASSAYRSRVVEALVERLRWIVVQAWKNEPLDQSSFEALVSEAPAPVEWTLGNLTPPGAPLLLWLLTGWGLAVTRLTRSERLSRGATQSVGTR